MELVYGVCLKYLKEPEEAQDAVMAIFEELVQKLKQHQVENVKSWLYTVAKNHCLMKLRQQKKMPVGKIPEEFMQSEEDGHLKDVLDREEHFRQLDHCMEQLADNQRKVIELFYLQGKCYNEISAETGIEWNSVRSYIQNGRRNLKNCMEAEQKKIVSE
jgi:RNA polymerase sigma-70 factor (ECF subfamily)